MRILVVILALVLAGVATGEACGQNGGLEGAQQAGEEAGISGGYDAGRPSAAKAGVDPVGFMRGLKPPPPSESSTSGASETSRPSEWSISGASKATDQGGPQGVAPNGAVGTVYEPPLQLMIEVEVPARLPAVWEAFTTSEGLSTWLTPHAVVDLRPGGEWTAHFPGGSTGGGTIVSFVPEKEIVLAALAPDKFPEVRAQRTRVVFQFEARGDSTIVRLTQTGWKRGDEWTRAYEYLLAGNAQLMATLHQRFVNGPLDWEKLFGDAPAPRK